MHLDLSPLLSKETVSQLDAIAIKNKHFKPLNLWADWVCCERNRGLPSTLMQACAQYLAAHHCVISSLVFGLYCSRFYRRDGLILSDDTALHYLRMSIATIEQERNEILAWLTANKAHCYLPFFENGLWSNACSVYLHHELQVQPKLSETDRLIEFAVGYVVNSQ